MFKLSPRRNQRSRGFKVKHAVQIFLLLGVCIWLLYQVKHSHDKKAAFNEGTKFSEKVQNGNKIVKLGRKDLHPLVEETPTEDERHREEENEEESKHEGEESSKLGESEDDGKGGVDDEIHEHNQEKTEKEVEHVEDFIEREKESEQGKEKESEENEGERSKEKGTEEKESEEKDIKEEEKEKSKYKESYKEEKEESKDKESYESGIENSKEKESEKEIKEEMKEEGNERESEEKQREEKQVQIEEFVSSQNQIDDGSDRKNEGPREEHYKGDDASSAVVQETESITNETEKGSLEKSLEEEQSEDKEKNEFEQENRSNSTEVGNVDQNEPGPNEGDGETVEKNDLSNVIATEEKGNEINLAESKDGSYPNSSIKTEANEQQKENNDSAGTSGLPQQNGIEMTSDSPPNHNETADDTISREGSSTIENVVLEQTEKSDAVASSEHSDLNVKLSTTIENVESGTKNSSTSSTNSENDDAGKTQGDIVYSNTNDNAAGQKESVDSSISREARDESSNTNYNADADENKNDDDAVQNKNSDVNSGTEKTEENNESTDKNDNTDAGQTETDDSSNSSANQEEKEASSNTDDHANVGGNDSTDSSNSSILQEEKEARTDLGTFPETGTEEHNREAATTE